MIRLPSLSVACAVLGLAASVSYGQLGTPKWIYTAANAITASSPALGADQTLYIGDWQTTMYAINGGSGTIKWTATTAAGYFIGDNSPALSPDGQVVYFTYYGKALTARSASTGVQLWTYNVTTAGDSSGNPTISGPGVGADGTIYFVGYDLKFYALNSNGTLKWVAGLPNGANQYTHPAIGVDGTVWAGSYGGALIGFHSDGTQAASLQTDGGAVSTPAVGSDGTLYVLGYGGLYAFKTDGTRKWKFTNASLQAQFPHAGPTIDASGVIYFECYGYLYAVNSDGSLKWQFATEHTEQNSGYSTPVVVSDGTIYVGSPSHKLYAVNPDGTSRWSFLAGDKIYSSPSVGPDGTVYFGCADGKVYALYGSAPLATAAAWPKLHRDLANSANGFPLPASAPGGLIAWWPLDGDGSDIVGGHNGTLTGAYYSFISGEVDQAMMCSAKSAGLSVADSTNLDFGPGADFSIEGWIQPQVATTDYGVEDIVDKMNATSPSLPNLAGYELATVYGQLSFSMVGGTGSPRPGLTAGPDLRDGKWHHVAVSIQRASTNGGNLYADGALVGTFDPTPVLAYDLSTSVPLLIGLHPSSWLDCNFRGGLDEISLYGRALSAADIQAIYTAGAAGKARPAPLPANLAGWWKMEGNAKDSSSGAHNGTLTGSYSFTPGEVRQGIFCPTKPAGISVPSSSALNFASGVDFSIEGWIQPQVATTDYGVEDIVDKMNATSPSLLNLAGYELCTVYGQLSFSMVGGTGSPRPGLTAGPDLRDGKWHHVAVSIQRASTTGGNLYVDGALVGTFDPTPVLAYNLSTSVPLLIGLHPSSWLDCNFRGGLDEISIYRRALSAAEIKGIYTAGGAGKQ